ncbi:MAG: TlpA disulfide reductase family protein, partial [Verrucomicrobiota bacterium]
MNLPQLPIHVATFLPFAPLAGQTSAPKSADKSAKAPAKSAADLSFEAFNRERGAPGARDQARFQKVIAAGLDDLAKLPTHSRANEVILGLAFYAGAIPKEQAALQTSYVSFLKLELANLRYKDEVSDATKAALAALDASVADFEVRTAFSRDNLTNFREKVDALAETPGAARCLADRERSYGHVITLGGAPARGEEHFRRLLDHKEKAVKDMAREELNFYEARKEPFALKFTGLDGKETDLSQLRGKVVALYFWSTTSKSSTDRLEALKQVYSDYRRRGFEVVTVCLDKAEDRAKVEQFVKTARIAFPVHFDGKGTRNDFAPKFNVTGAPRLLVFDQKGMLQMNVQGSPVGRIVA